MEVYKFGGASVNGADAIKNVARILKLESEPKILVFSAMGKTTNALEFILSAFYNEKPEAEAMFKKLIADHIAIIQALFEADSKAMVDIMPAIRNIMGEMYKALQICKTLPYDTAYDSIVSFGERLSTVLISSYLNAEGIDNIEVDARSLICTDNRHREAKVLWKETEANILEKLKGNLVQHKWIITQGFISSTENGLTTTLGREGSDYSAAIIAHCVNAEKMTIWKDVPGVLNADPKYFTDTQKLDYISYSDATELAYFGASVIHPKTIKPLQNKHIPLYVRSFLQPEEEGTWVGLDNVEYTKIPSFIFKPHQILLSVYTRDFSFIEEVNLARIFDVLAKCGIKVNLMQNSALSFSLCVDAQKGRFKEVVDILTPEFECVYNEDVDLITVRHYNQEVINRVVMNRPVLLEQRTRNDVQLVVCNNVK